MAILSIPRVLNERLTEEGVNALVEVLSSVEESAVARALQVVEERFERRLAEELGRLRAEMAQIESRLLKWMFIFWIGQFASVVGVLTAILFAFFKK